MREPSPAIDWNCTLPQLAEWYASFLGRSMLEQTNVHLAGMLQPVFGYQGLQVGLLHDGDSMLENAGLLRRFTLGADMSGAQIDASTSALELPIASDTLSLLALPHTLEFCTDPHQVLREADRVLARDGYLLLLGFNPLSTWGAAHAVRRWNPSVPWSGQFYTNTRVQDWLSLLNFKVVSSKKFFLRPPIHHEKVLRKLEFVEKCQPWLSVLGGAYLILARKQVRPLIPKMLRWRPRKSVVASRMIEPVNKVEMQKHRER
ncbi:MAG: methyltransferase domain-containing protein [Pseudomonadota bacterium]